MEALKAIWDLLVSVHDYFYNPMGNAFYYFLGFLAVIAMLAQWRLYEKCRQPGWTAFVPVLNVIVFLRIVGRPAKHGWHFLIPFYGQLYFLPKVWIEVCQCFGKRTTLDYVLVILFNGLYILNLAMSEDSYYQGPVYGKQQAPPPPRKLSSQPSLA